MCTHRQAQLEGDFISVSFLRGIIVFGAQNQSATLSPMQNIECEKWLWVPGGVFVPGISLTRTDSHPDQEEPLDLRRIVRDAKGNVYCGHITRCNVPQFIRQLYALARGNGEWVRLDGDLTPNNKASPDYLQILTCSSQETYSIPLSPKGLTGKLNELVWTGCVEEGRLLNRSREFAMITRLPILQAHYDDGVPMAITFLDTILDYFVYTIQLTLAFAGSTLKDGSDSRTIHFEFARANRSKSRLLCHDMQPLVFVVPDRVDTAKTPEDHQKMILTPWIHKGFPEHQWFNEEAGESFFSEHCDDHLILATVPEGVPRGRYTCVPCLQVMGCRISDVVKPELRPSKSVVATELPQESPPQRLQEDPVFKLLKSRFGECVGYQRRTKIKHMISSPFGLNARVEETLKNSDCKQIDDDQVSWWLWLMQEFQRMKRRSKKVELFVDEEDEEDEKLGDRLESVWALLVQHPKWKHLYFNGKAWFGRSAGFLASRNAMVATIQRLLSKVEIVRGRHNKLKVAMEVFNYLIDYPCSGTILKSHTFCQTMAKKWEELVCDSVASVLLTKYWSMFDSRSGVLRKCIFDSNFQKRTVSYPLRMEPFSDLLLSIHAPAVPITVTLVHKGIPLMDPVKIGPEHITKSERDAHQKPLEKQESSGIYPLNLGLWDVSGHLEYETPLEFHVQFWDQLIFTYMDGGVEVVETGYLPAPAKSFPSSDFEIRMEVLAPKTTIITWTKTNQTSSTECNFPPPGVGHVQIKGATVNGNPVKYVWDNFNFVV